ncbi:MAG TPA: dipicolinate synthase subunit DpsA [Bacillota bacterium]|nr:dipicolinate synthase subunit DpsA [Bacillota bacterium]HPL53385.1 dipicolinate synthase subunit DpsA [Bacillota bacterium]
MKSLRYLIIGGDDRLAELAAILERNGDNIATYGMDMIEIEGVFNYLSLEKALENSDIIVCPVPFSKEVYKINSKYSSVDIEIEELFKKLGKGKTLVLGAINSYSRDMAIKYNIEYMDYCMDESYQILNAIPTAEGALSILINETKETLYGSKILVLGYGRIGKLISEYLKALRAEVYVEARKDSDLTWITARGMNAIPMDQFSLYLGEMDVIVNTIPAMVLDCTRLDKVKNDVFILDLASTPGGTDFIYATEKGIQTIHALGIPGKIACKSAAAYIYNTMQKILYRQKGVDYES